MGRKKRHLWPSRCNGEDWINVRETQHVWVTVNRFYWFSIFLFLADSKMKALDLQSGRIIVTPSTLTIKDFTELDAGMYFCGMASNNKRGDISPMTMATLKLKCKSANLTHIHHSTVVAMRDHLALQTHQLSVRCFDEKLMLFVSIFGTLWTLDSPSFMGFQEAPRSGAFSSGVTVRLQCSVSAWPAPRFRWFYNGEEIIEEMGNIKVSRNMCSLVGCVD